MLWKLYVVGIKTFDRRNRIISKYNRRMVLYIQAF